MSNDGGGGGAVKRSVNIPRGSTSFLTNMINLKISEKIIGHPNPKKLG